MTSIGDLKKRILFRSDQGESLSVPDWLPISLEIFHEILTEKAYPCYLGSAAEKQNELLLTYIEDDDRVHLPQTLSSFLAISAAEPDRRYIFAIFFKPEERLQCHEYYKGKFWSLLQFLHENDPCPWPLEFPMDPLDPHWEFTFDRTAAFVFLGAPSYKHRRSRNLGPGMVVLYQPRRVFEGIEGGTSAGTKTRQIIRHRLKNWDNIEAHPDMGSFGDSSNNEWKQYVLPNDNTIELGECPLRIKPSSDFK